MPVGWRHRVLATRAARPVRYPVRRSSCPGLDFEIAIARGRDFVDRIAADDALLPPNDFILAGGLAWTCRQQIAENDLVILKPLIKLGDGAGKDDAPAKPHFAGHRQRLKERFLKTGGDQLPDYELLELLLFQALPRRDVKPLAKDLLARFGSFAGVVSAEPALIRGVPGAGEAVVVALKTVAAAAETHRAREAQMSRELEQAMPWRDRQAPGFAV